MGKNEFYCLATFAVKPIKLKAFQDFWRGNLEVNGAEHIATFTTIAGREGSNAVMSLFKIADLNAWFRGKVGAYFTPELNEYCDGLEYTFMDLCDYSVLPNFYEKGEADCAEGLNFYFWADIEIKSNRMLDYHARWKETSIQHHREMGAEHIATFNIISGQACTTHVKRLFRITDLEAWADGEVACHHRSNLWYDTANKVWTTSLYPLPYSHLR